MSPIVPEGGWLLALSRALAEAALFSAFGALLFRRAVLPKLAERFDLTTVERRTARLAAASLVMAIPLLLAWAVCQTIELAPTGSDLRKLAAALPTAIGVTEFGHVWLAQLLAVLAGLTVVWRRPGLALIPITVAVVLQAGHSHALSMYGGPSVLLASDIVHLLAAAAWLGGLLPLLLSVSALPPLGGALAARWFSPLGKLCVVAMTVTAGYQGWQLIASMPGLVGTGYGELALIKLTLFGVLFAFAVANRYRLAPALLRGETATARRNLVRSVAIQTGFGLAIVVAAGVLSNLAPALHEQPTWPFSLQPSLVTVDEDPEFKRTALVAVLEVAAASLLLAGTLLWRRWRIVAALAASTLTWVAAPDLRLLFIPAYPTSFFQSPTDFAATSIVHGAALFGQNCVVCHGAGGRGDGPGAAGLAVPPADLTQPHLWAHSDGEMFWWLTRGIDAPEGGMAMPGFAAKLNVDDRWALIDFVRANNAGVAQHETGAWPEPVAAPNLVADCPGGSTLALSSLRGQAVRLVFADAPPPALSDDPNLVTITVGQAPPSACAARDPAVTRAYALIMGEPEASLVGQEIFVDPNGWLRAASPANAAPAALAALARDISAHPLEAAIGGHHHDH